MKIPINVSRTMDVFSGDQANNQQALGQLFEKIKLHKKMYPYAYPMRAPDAPPGVPWVSPQPPEEAGVLVTPGEPSTQEPEPRESN
eukprot:12072452-Karenia_brevis.AAC.1